MSPKRSAAFGPPASIPRPGPVGPARTPSISTGSGGFTQWRKRRGVLYPEQADYGGGGNEAARLCSASMSGPVPYSEQVAANMLRRYGLGAIWQLHLSAAKAY